jgi:hypothetical protein
VVGVDVVMVVISGDVTVVCSGDVTVVSGNVGVVVGGTVEPGVTVVVVTEQQNPTSLA